LNPTRENLILGLHKLGISAKIAKRRRPEQKTGENSIGLIDIENSPISWINVRNWWDYEGPEHYATDYGIPDSRPLPDIKIRSVRVRNFPLLGNVIDVRWKGNNMNVAHHLTKDEAIREAIIASHSEITVLTHPKQGCWLIPRSGREVPKPSQWDCYQRIAAKLLVAPLTHGEK